ncbi:MULTISPECIES: hypothetical protein [unclassified Vibrio]|uniref:hypothetical protein n=1 Tax=unclassified Vibrio TaxID=2614977 RepID=UPI0010BDD7BC|nr:hypothetical protein [Vibrio sp. F13]TKF73443.1 hypothetical protein FCV55_03460 [Vibrio sp. F13]CAK4004156.1 hypothetical protein VCRA212O16_640007 [Vibrio crassostreae]
MELVECSDLIHNDIRCLLAGIDTSTTQMESFLISLSKEWEKQIEKDETLKEKVGKENRDRVLAAMMAALDGQGKNHPKQVEFNPTSLVDLILQYCKGEIKSFWNFYIEIEDEIADGCKYVLTEKDICLGSKKAKKKVDNAIKEYAHAPSGLSNSYDIKEYIPSYDVWESDILVKFDTTVFGSGKTGICFTNNFVVFKGISTIPHSLYYYRKIDKISVDQDDKELIIKGLSSTGDTGDYFKYICYNINDELSKVVDCVNEYISQPALKVVKHLEAL